MSKTIKRAAALICCFSFLCILCMPLSAHALDFEDGRVRDKDGIIGDLDDYLDSEGRRVRDDRDGGMRDDMGMPPFSGIRNGTSADSGVPTDDGGSGLGGIMGSDSEPGTDMSSTDEMGGVTMPPAENGQVTSEGTSAATDAPNGSGNQSDDTDEGIGALGIFIAIAVAIIIIVVVIIAIPKNKGKPGSTGKNH